MLEEYKGRYVMIYRKATFNDVEEIFNLVNIYAKDGVMLARSRNTLAREYTRILVPILRSKKLWGYTSKTFPIALVIYLRALTFHTGRKPNK